MLNNSLLRATGAPSPGEDWKYQDGLSFSKLEWARFDAVTNINWNGSQFLVKSGTGRVAISTDGKNWTTHLGLHNLWEKNYFFNSTSKLLWNGSHYLVITRILYKPPQISASTDGINWTKINTNSESITTGVLSTFGDIAWTGTAYVMTDSNSSYISYCTPPGSLASVWSWYKVRLVGENTGGVWSSTDKIHSIGVTGDRVVLLGTYGKSAWDSKTGNFSSWSGSKMTGSTVTSDLGSQYVFSKIVSNGSTLLGITTGSYNGRVAISTNNGSSWTYTSTNLLTVTGSASMTGNTSLQLKVYDVISVESAFYATAKVHNFDSRYPPVKILKSLDGITWTDLGNIFTSLHGFELTTFDNYSSQLDYTGSTLYRGGFLAYKPDPSPEPRSQNIIIAGNQGKIAGGYSKGYLKDDFTTFSESLGKPTSIFGRVNARSIGYNGSNFLVCGDEARVATSSDGITWNYNNGLYNQQFAIYYTEGGSGANCVIWAKNKWIVGGYGGNIATSPDGINWTYNGQIWDFSIAAANFSSNLKFLDSYVNSIAYNGTNRYVVVGSNNELWYGTDNGNSITWTGLSYLRDIFGYKTSTADTYKGCMESVIWANGQFVAVGWNGRCITSPDGINWTNRTNTPGGLSTSGRFTHIIWNGSKYVALSGGGLSVSSSSDGITWNQNTVSSVYQSNFSKSSIVYTGNKYIIVASVKITSTTGGTVTTNNMVFTSRDLITWKDNSKLNTTDFENYEVYGMTYGNGKVVVCGKGGKIATSP